MNINKTYVGKKFYKYIDGELYILKVLVDKDPNSFKCSVTVSYTHLTLPTIGG